MPLAQIAEPWPTMELVQLEAEVMRPEMCLVWRTCLPKSLYHLFWFDLNLEMKVNDRCGSSSVAC